MFSRVINRSLRHYAKPALVQPNLPQSFSRAYAKHNKHKRPHEQRIHKVPPSGPQINRNIPGTESARESVAHETGNLPSAANPTIRLPSETQNSPSLQQRVEQVTEVRSSSVSYLKDEAQIQPVADVQSPSPTDNARLPDESGIQSQSTLNSGPHSSPSFAPEKSESNSEPLRPLPDLTKGIPSTLDSEIAEASLDSRSNPTSLKIGDDPPNASAGSRQGADFPNSAYISSLERRRNRIANFMYAGIFGFSIFGTIYLGRNWDTEDEELKHPDAPSGWGFGLFYNRASARLRDMLDYYNEPAFPKLLPKPDPMIERPYTLVLSLEDLLVHSEWTREHGWRSAKRPGVDYFLQYLSQYYELVIFTSVASMNADPIIRKLDPFRIVMWPLFREATRFKDGKYIKDLSYLNRDLSKVILIDTVPDHAKLQPENAIILPKWKGTLPDIELVSLIPFLEYIATMGFNDTREILKSFAGTHIPTEYAKREAIARERFHTSLAEERAKRPRRSGVGMLGNALGIKPMGSGLDGAEQTLSEALEQGKTYQDLVRERGQRQYEILEKEIRENGDKWLKEMVAEEEKMKEETMKGMKSSFTGFFGLGGAGK